LAGVCPASPIVLTLLLCSCCLQAPRLRFVPAFRRLFTSSQGIGAQNHAVLHYLGYRLPSCSRDFSSQLIFDLELLLWLLGLLLLQGLLYLIMVGRRDQCG
jgi:hypothetical protein